VENAVKHGREPLSEGGFVTVVAKPERENASIIVEDSGVGIKEDFSVDALRPDGKYIVKSETCCRCLPEAKRHSPWNGYQRKAEPG
jgi:LytS/YehU family sensor histidine kinase